MKKTRPTIAVLTAALFISSASINVFAEPSGAMKCSPYPMCAIYFQEETRQLKKEKEEAKLKPLSLSKVASKGKKVNFSNN